MERIRIFSTFFFVTALHLSANDTVTYTINGEKDPRLVAYYELTYTANSKENECMEKRGDLLVPKTKTEIFDVDDEEYLLHITIDTKPQEGDECAYEFQSLNLIVKRLYDEEVYNQFPVVGRYPSASTWQKGNWAIPVYHGTSDAITSPLGFFSKRNKIPYAFRSDKRYFRLHYQNRFNCMTSRYDDSPEVEFMCLMDISDTLYDFQPCDPSSSKIQNECGTVHHPQFETNALIDQSFRIDIIADDSKSMRWNTSSLKLQKDTFQVPDASLWDEFKHFFTSFSFGKIFY